MKETKNLKLKKPDYTDVADIADINANMDILDAELNKKSDTGHKHPATEIIANTDLNELNNEGYYWCNSTNSESVINKPDKITYKIAFFSLRISIISGGVLSQELTTSDNRKFIRICWSGAWTDWDKYVLKKDIPTSLKNPNALTISLNGTSQGSYDGSVAKSINITATSIGAANSNHSHSANSITGLGAAATRGVATAVSNGSTNLVTSGAVYSAINNLNISNRTHIVVATYDTKNPLKANADYTCTSTNASSVLKTAINAVAQGGRVELLDGTYILQYSEDEINLTKDITIEGCGYRTTIHQPVDEDAGEAKPVFVISGQNVKLKSMMLCDKNVSSPVPIIRQQTQGAIYEDVFFIFNAGETSGGGACISGSNDCNYTRIQNCRVYKGFNDSNRVMFDFGNCTKFGGVFGANISSGYNNISIRFANEGHKNNTAIYGHSNIDIMISA